MRFDAHTAPQQTLELIDELTAQGNHAYLATTRDGGGLVGVFALKKDPDHPGSATLTVFLDKSRWGNGYCGELLAFALEHAPAMGFSSSGPGWWRATPPPRSPWNPPASPWSRS